MIDGPATSPSGYAVHPSFAAPVRFTPVIELGVTVRMMGDWPERFTDEEQEAQL